MDALIQILGPRIPRDFLRCPRLAHTPENVIVDLAPILKILILLKIYFFKHICRSYLDTGVAIFVFDSKDSGKRTCFKLY